MKFVVFRTYFDEKLSAKQSWSFRELLSNACAGRKIVRFCYFEWSNARKKKNAKFLKKASCTFLLTMGTERLGLQKVNTWEDIPGCLGTSCRGAQLHLCRVCCPSRYQSDARRVPYRSHHPNYAVTPYSANSLAFFLVFPRFFLGCRCIFLCCPSKITRKT